MLTSSSAVAVTISGTAVIKHCQYVYTSTFSTLTFSNASGIPLTVSNSNVRFDANTEISGSASYSGIFIDNGATVKIGNITINNCNRAIETTRLGRFYATTITGSGNNAGIYGTGGSQISYNSNTISATTPYTLSDDSIITNSISEDLTDISQNLGTITAHEIYRTNRICQYRLSAMCGDWTANTGYQINTTPIPSIYRPLFSYTMELKLSDVLSGYVMILTSGYIYIYPRSTISNSSLAINVTFISA